MIGGAQQDAAQADDVAWDREVDHLPPAVRQQLVGAGPAVLEDVGVMPCLPLADQVGAGGNETATLLEPANNGQLHLAQRQVSRQLAHQGAVRRQACPCNR